MDYPTSRWNDHDLIKRFSEKDLGDFFISDHIALHTISLKLEEISILDLGCACGKLNSILQQYFTNWSYTGIDLSSEQIEIARSLYPEHTFFCSTIEETNNIVLKRNQLVYCVGVAQHVKGLNWLINIMNDLSSRFIVFDLKLHNKDYSITDLEISNTGVGDNKIHYNIYSRYDVDSILDKYFDDTNIIRIEYKAKPNPRVVLPSNIDFFNTTYIIEKK
tara:strand:- start:1677 stop:2333 length:657 start_codon:yes stop_codon:yes gene_type:complete